MNVQRLFLVFHVNFNVFLKHELQQYLTLYSIVLSSYSRQYRQVINRVLLRRSKKPVFVTWLSLSVKPLLDICGTSMT